MLKNELLNKEEYEPIGKNEFPLKYLTYEEKIELGLIKKSCCGNSKSCCKNGKGCCKNRIDIKCNKKESL